MSNKTSPPGEPFDWKEYLALTNSIAAPPEAFCQSTDPPKNSFEDDMILEAFDPRFPSIRCLAEVTAVYGPKIRLRMIGAGDNDDIWIIVDSHQIRPIGTAESQGVLITPPFNCRFDAGRFSKMRKKAVANSPHAPKECFLPEPQKPSANKFKIGQKLEACDTRDPVFVCPATVKDVKDEKISVEFDGWNICEWFRYDSRDIFPVGWWERSGAKIQGVPIKRKRGGGGNPKPGDVTPEPPAPPPPTGDQKVDSQPPPPAPMACRNLINLFDDNAQNLTGNFENMTTRVVEKIENGVKNEQPASAPVLTGNVQPGFSVGGTAAEKCLGIVKPRAKKTIAAASVAPMMRQMSIPSPVTSSQNILNSSVDSSSSTSKRHRLATPSQLSNIEAAVESVRQAAAQGSQQPSPPLHTMSIGGTKRPLTPNLHQHQSTGFIQLKARRSPTLDGTPETSDFVVYVNGHCSTGRWLDPAKIACVRNARHGPGGVNHVMRSCLQLLVDSAYLNDASHVLNCCTLQFGETTAAADGNGPSLSADVSGSTVVRRLPIFHSSLDAWKYLSEVLDRLQTCPHLLAKRYGSCAACVPTHHQTPSQPSSKKAKVSPTVDALSLDSGLSMAARGRHISGGSSSSACTDRDLTSNAYTGNEIEVSRWTVDDVTRFVYNASDSATADVFKKQEIDGKALLLLTADMMIRYMNVRLGPALKISNAIESTKAGKSNTV